MAAEEQSEETDPIFAVEGDNESQYRYGFLVATTFVPSQSQRAWAQGGQASQSFTPRYINSCYLVQVSGAV